MYYDPPTAGIDWNPALLGRINPSKQKTPASLSCMQVKPGAELSSYFQPSPLATTCYVYARLSHNHKQLSDFIWFKLFTTSISDRIATFLQKKNKKAFGTSEKGFGITKNLVAGA